MNEDFDLETALGQSGSFTSVSNKVADIEEALDVILDGGGGSEGGGGDAPTPDSSKRIAMFIIPVNVTDQEPYVGFELKASTNNFTGTTQQIKTQFYSQSEFADTGSSTQDKMKIYVGTSLGQNGSAGVRQYTRINNTLSWTQRLTTVVVLVDATCLIRHPEDNGSWLNADNQDLMWCYCRDRNNDPPYEYESGTTKSLWRPIAPVRWLTRLPNWAN